MLLVVCVTVDASEHGIKRRRCYTDIIVCHLYVWSDRASNSPSFASCW